MNRSVLLGGILLVLVPGIWAFRGLEREGSVRENVDRDFRSKSGRARRGMISPTEAMRKLRELHGLGKANTSFDQIEEFSRRLSDEDLQKMIDLVGMTELEGVQGWLRSALWTEWARRDHEAALAALQEAGKFDLSAKDASHQVFYSVYRGWALSDLDGAYEALRRWMLNNDRGGQRFHHFGMDRWGPYAALQEIMKMRSDRDPERTWQELVNVPNEGAALKGFFNGLTGGEVAEYVTRWQREHWDTAGAREAFRWHKDGFLGPSDSGLYFVLIPREESNAMIVGPALAQHDLESAVEWLSNNGPGGAATRENRVAAMMRHWASANPEGALSVIDDPRYAKYAAAIGHGGIEGNPALASAAVEAMGPEGARTPLEIANIVASRSPEIHFPAPGRNNLQPDQEAHYEALLEAVLAGGFEGREEAELLGNVHRAFKGTLPRAQAAFGGCEQLKPPRGPHDSGSGKEADAGRALLEN